MLTRNAGLIVAFVAAGSVLLSAQAPKIDVSERALIGAAVRYVADYETQFAFLIADENYVQTLYNADGREIQKRVLTAELFLTYLPADDTWMAIRDVSDVDGQPIKDRDDLRALLLKSRELRLMARLAERNARFNIGRVERTFNEPTLPLLLLDPKRAPRVKFDRRSVVRAVDETLATLAFEEPERPTLIVTKDFEAVRGRGELVIDAATGAVRHTTFQFARPGIDVKLETSYVKDEKLNLWLPSVFTERYESGGTAGGRRPRNAFEAGVRELVECQANYSNYRRFDVTGRIK